MVELKQIGVNISTVVVVFSLFSSCEKNESVYGTSVVNTVPFLTGTSNSYVWDLNTVDSTGKIISAANDSFSIHVISDNVSLGNYTNLVLLEANKIGSTTVLQKVWYKSTKDSLVEIAYQIFDYPGFLFPKQQYTRTTGFLFSLPIFLQNSLRKNTDSLRWRDDIRIVYKYPLSIGKTWVSFHQPFIQTREVIGLEMVKVRAGTFFCTKIKSTVGEPFFMPPSEPLVYYDFVSEQGLILRTFSSKVVHISYSGPDSSIGHVAVNERLELISHH